MTFEELGAALSAERKKRNLRIEDIAERLKIGVRLLRALEEGDASSLPHRAYAKGFIRVYSSFLGFAAEEVNEAVSFLGSVDNTEVTQPVYTQDAAPRSGLKWLGALLVLLLLAGGGYIAWHQGLSNTLDRPKRLANPSPPAASQQSQPGQTAQTQAPVTVQTQPARNATQATGAESAPMQPAAQVPQGTASVSPAVPAAPITPASAQNTTTQTNPAANGTPAPASTVTRAAIPAGTPYKVIITATEECWIHSNADDTETRQFSLHRGETFALTFNKKLEVKLGNAGGVSIRYNGEEMPPVGQSGQVRTLTFPLPAARQ